jgi:hypothetical protein
MTPSQHIEAAAKANQDSLNAYDPIKAYEFALLALKHGQEAGKLGGDPTRPDTHEYVQRTAHQRAFFAASRAYDKAKLYKDRKAEAKELSAMMKLHRTAFIALGGSSKNVSRR